MPEAVRVAAITVSDTRTEADDVGGAALKERLEAAPGCWVVLWTM